LKQLCQTKANRKRAIMGTIVQQNKPVTARAKVKVEPISGFPELLPHERMAEQMMIATIQQQYERFSFVPIETPAVERLEVLTAKGGMQRQVFSLGRPEEDEANQA